MQKNIASVHGQTRGTGILQSLRSNARSYLLVDKSIFNSKINHPNENELLFPNWTHGMQCWSTFAQALFGFFFSFSIIINYKLTNVPHTNRAPNERKSTQHISKMLNGHFNCNYPIELRAWTLFSLLHFLLLFQLVQQICFFFSYNCYGPIEVCRVEMNCDKDWVRPNRMNIQREILHFNGEIFHFTCDFREFRCDSVNFDTEIFE